MPNSAQSPDIGQNSDGGISDFRIFGQSLIKENRHNSRTDDDIDMKLELNFTRETKQHQKQIDHNIMSKNCDIIVIFPIYSQFGAIQKPASRHIVCKTYISLTVTFYLTKTENRTKKSPTQLSH